MSSLRKGRRQAMANLFGTPKKVPEEDQSSPVPFGTTYDPYQAPSTPPPLPPTTEEPEAESPSKK
jgi:hypothetical protein